MKFPTIRDITFAVPVPKWKDPLNTSQVRLPDHKNDLKTSDLNKINRPAWEILINEAVNEINDQAHRRKIQDVELLAIKLSINLKQFHCYICDHLTPQKPSNIRTQEKNSILQELHANYEDLQDSLRILGMFHTFPIYRTMTLKLLFSEKKQLNIRYSELNRRAAELHSNLMIYLTHTKIYLDQIRDSTD